MECIHTKELWPFLKETNNFPLHRYIYRADLNPEILEKYQYDFSNREYADCIDGMPACTRAVGCPDDYTARWADWSVSWLNKLFEFRD